MGPILLSWISLLLSGATMSLRLPILSGFVATLLTDLNLETPQVQTGRSQLCAQLFLLTGEHLTEFRAVGRQMRMDRMVGQDDTNTKLTKICGSHVELHGMGAWNRRRLRIEAQLVRLRWHGSRGCRRRPNVRRSTSLALLIGRILAASVA